MHCVVVIKLLGGVGQNLPEDGSHIFRQIACQQHGELPIHLSPEFAAQMSITVATCWRQLCVELLFFSVHRLVVFDLLNFFFWQVAAWLNVSVQAALQSTVKDK